MARRRRTGGGARVAVHELAHGSALLIVHHAEVERHAGNAIECTQRAIDATLNFVAQWTAGDSQHHRQADCARVGNDDIADHAEVDDRAMQLGVLHRAQGLDYAVRGQGRRHEGLQ
jgi:hypothetical protein